VCVLGAMAAIWRSILREGLPSVRLMGLELAVGALAVQSVHQCREGWMNVRVDPPARISAMAL
jgi:hypothetical protein